MSDLMRRRKVSAVAVCMNLEFMIVTRVSAVTTSDVFLNLVDKFFVDKISARYVQACSFNDGFATL